MSHTPEHKIIAIGGGEIDKRKKNSNEFYPAETIVIDAEILRLTNKPNARLLFIPTASGDSSQYYETVKKHFLSIGFSEVNVLYLSDKSLSKKNVQNLILSHDAIYVGGGNTLKMMTIWRKTGVDKLLRKALDEGIVLSGLSAGAICWFSQGSADRRQAADGTRIIKVSGLDFIQAIACPHYDSDPDIKTDIKMKMMKHPNVAICLDDCTALEVIGNQYRIITSKASAKAYKVFWLDGRYHVEELVASDSLMSLESLVSKTPGGNPLITPLLYDQIV